MLASIPADPYDGLALRFKRLREGVAIYSVGSDRQDDHGNIRRDRPLDPGVDFGFRLWDPGQRRRPSRPPVALER